LEIAGSLAEGDIACRTRDAMNYVYLFAAIVSEVIATSALKAAEGFSRFWPSVIVIVGYGLAFYCLSLTMRTIPIGVAYAIWSGVGIVLIALVGLLFYRQPLDPPALIGMALILAGVLIINVFSRTAGHLSKNARHPAGASETDDRSSGPIALVSAIAAEVGEVALVFLLARVLVERVRDAGIARIGRTRIGRFIGPSETGRRRHIAQGVVLTAEGMGQGIGDHHAARDTRRRRESGPEEPAPATALHHAAAPGTGRAAHHATLGSAVMLLGRMGLTPRRRLADRRRVVGRSRWARCAAAEDAGQETALLGLAAGVIDLGPQLLVLGLEIGQGLLLNEDRLRQGIGRIGLLAQLLGDEALGLRIPRLVRHLLQASEDIADDLAFLIVHGMPPSIDRWRRM
jgi:small multidrug resistance pump